MRDVLPAYAQGRATKGDYSRELYGGLRRHRAELLELCEESVLVEMGLVDRVALRGLLLGLHPDTALSWPSIRHWPASSGSDP
ncbi:hypothetical protein [Streptomyces sp. WAC 01529]|uniref:hypothetical protein n=1 Tax=Streptomyces sp. WAC 01529 TaxID=2203205 RepID=UPI000F745554|nr:hypothetical protein [Streptomyces sp. WAC 01529]